MSQLYARVFLKVLDSSIANNFKVRHVFEDFLKLADDGVVDMTRDAIARRLNIPEAELNEAIAVLEGPDPKSRNPDHDGRRLMRLDEHRDWGWVIVNWGEYESIRNKEDNRAKTLQRVHRYREKQKLTPSPHPSQTLDSASASAPEGVLQKRYTPLQGVTPLVVKEYWNTKQTLRKILTLSKGRQTHLMARLREPFFRDNWRVAIDKISESDWCQGKGPSGWRADIDFFLKPDTVAKAVEGAYDNRGKPEASGDPGWDNADWADADGKIHKASERKP